MEEGKVHYPETLKVLSEVSAMFTKYFPNTLILPALGNNDTKWHYQPALTEHDQYYSFLFNEFFMKHPANRSLKSISDIKETVEKGGYYRIDLTDDLTVLSLNTLFYNDQAAFMMPAGIEQMEWLED